MTATLNVATKATIVDNNLLKNALHYCSVEKEDWYIRAQISESGRNIEAWLHWCVDRAGLDDIIAQELACVDFTPSTWSDKESGEAKWYSVEQVPYAEDVFQWTIPEDAFYFCRYLISEDL